MKRAIVLTTIFATIAVLGMSVSSPVIAHDSLQSAKTSTPVVTKTPVKQPAPQTSPQSVLPYRSTIVVKDDGTSSPVAVISSNEPRTLPITMTMKTMQWTGAPLPKDRTFAPTHPMRTPKAGELVDNWEQIFNDGFETVFPYTPFCVLRDMSNDGFERVWGKDSLHVFGGNSAIWPARGGVDGVNPATNFYPSNMESRLVCGPFDITNYQTIMTRYMRWMDIDDPNDKFWWGYSTDGTWFYWLDWTGVANYWVEQSVYLDLPSGKSQVWIVLAFSSDWNTATSRGVWIDNLEQWRYKPTVTCGNLDLGNKGIHFAAYEKAFEQWFPIIRAGETNALTGLMQADPKWVRLPFMIPRDPPPNDAPPWSAVDTEHYDRMVDSLCNAGISVLGLLNHETLTRPLSEADNNTTAASYRQEFAGEAIWLAYHFRNRVKYWEVWNEPRFTAPLNASHYAALLNTTSSSIKANNPNAKVLFAGLEHAWNFYNSYFLEVYNRLDDEQGHARPFDIFAIHPYPDDNYGKDPMWYMHVVTETLAGNKTIIDKFVTTMEQNGDAGKRVWITEVGWNSALGSPNEDSMSVDKITQAFYLQQGFDILLKEARSVDKVFWYKYMDQDNPMSASTFNRIVQGEDWRMRLPGGGLFDPASPLVNVPSYWGLYNNDRLTPKPSRCAFKFYPQRCPDLPWFTFLPFIRRGQ